MPACGGESRHGANGSLGTGGSNATGGASIASGGSAVAAMAGQPASGGVGGLSAAGGASGGDFSGAGRGGNGGFGGAAVVVAGRPGTDGSGGNESGTGGGGTTGGGVAGAGGVSPDVTVHLDQQRQTMDGFGMADAFAPALEDAVADQFFDPVRGIGLSILRVTMGPTGSAQSSNVYSDILAAHARGVNTFIATAYSAAASCKSNGNENDGGYLNADCYDSWSDDLAMFPALVKANTGVDLYGISPQQEPDFASCGTKAPCNGDFPSMLYTSDELTTFVKLLGPKLHALNPPVRLMGPDSQEWIHLWKNESAPGGTDPLKGTGYDYGHALFADPTAWALMDTISTQQYDTQVAEPWPSDVPQTKPIWMTEMSGIKYWPEQGPSSDIDNGVVVAGWIHDAIVNGPASAWLYFWHQALTTDDNEGLWLKDGTVTKRFYTLGNFSKFVRPGSTRMNITGEVPNGVLLTAYAAPDGTLVVVAINRNTDPASVPIFVAGGSAPAALTPYVTSATDNLAPRATLTPSGGAFTAALDGVSVTTFVGTSAGGEN
jgi:glucuronoarabinoxylan endo-1,4-beta-xylanase